MTGRPREAAKLLQQGSTPAQIAKHMGISVESVEGYLWRAVGEGFIRRSDVLFSFPKTVRQAVERTIQAEPSCSAYDLACRVRPESSPLEHDELRILRRLLEMRVGHGDLYEFITDTEKLLHEQIRQTLVAEFGEAESGWWRKGVPEKVRVDCSTAREKDPEGDCDPFAYTTFIHLREILDRQWPLFQDRLPKDIANNRKEFLRDLETLNGIRNRVMHPTRLHKISDEDFEFAREMHRKLRAEAWRDPSNET